MPVVSKREAMRLLGVSKRTLERRLADGTIASHVAHGPHGPERRVHLPDPPSPPSPPTDDPGTGVIPAPPAPPPAILPNIPDRELAVLALRALDDMRAERDELRAVVESLRRPWWRKIGDRWRRAR